MRLSVPIEFELPAGWRPVPPDEVGLDLAFVAIKLDTHGSGFTATIVVDGVDLPPGGTLVDLADGSAGALPSAIVVARSAWQGPHGPRLSQALRLTTMAGTGLRRVLRVEEYLALPDPARPGGHGVVRALSTATVDQADAVASAFGTFVAGLGPHASSAAQFGG